MNHTKERILEKALELFSVKGFQAVSTREIAEAVGVQKGALYNHFKNKQDIFDQIIYYVEDYTKKMNVALSFPTMDESNSVVQLQQLSKNDLIELSCNMFETYIKDTTIMRFRRMYMIEQYTNDEIRKRYQNYFIDSMIDRITYMNQQLMNAGIYKKSDPRTLAIWYFSASFLLINRYDDENIDLEQVLTILRGCLEHFMDEVFVDEV